MSRFFYLICLLSFLLSCTNLSNNTTNENTITIKDYFDRKIQIPINVKRVLPLFYVQAEMICVLGASNKIVGIGKLFEIQSTIIHEHFPQLYKLPQVGNESNINFEKVIALKPDIVFCGLEKNATESLDQLNIKNLSTFPKNPLQISEQILLYGKILDKSENAIKIVNFLNNKFEEIVKRTKIIKKNARPKVYYARTDLFTTLGKGINSDLIHLVGGVSVTKDLPNDMNGIKISLENLYKWNPDIIILRDRASITPDDVYKDDRLKGIDAVKNKRVYQETFSWTEFRIGMYFGMLEKSKWLHPDLFQDINPKNDYENFVKLYQSFD